MTTQERIRELEGKIVACGHSKFIAGRFECDQERSQCHSKRVRRWLDETRK